MPANPPVTFLANGWDNAMFRVGDELAARVPRRGQVDADAADSADNPQLLGVGHRTVATVLG
jgi:hypothetical protein